MSSKAAASKVVAFTPSKPIRRKINLRTPLGKRNEHWVTVEHTQDPKRAILDKIGPAPADFVQFSRILVAVYIPPLVSKTAGGIILTDGMQKEDLDEFLWQGKVGLIVAMGPDAYQDDENIKFKGLRNEVGDWVWFKPSDGDALEANEVFCRVFDAERFIRGKLPHPDYVW